MCCTLLWSHKMLSCYFRYTLCRNLRKTRFISSSLVGRCIVWSNMRSIQITSINRNQKLKDFILKNNDYWTVFVRNDVNYGFIFLELWELFIILSSQYHYRSPANGYEFTERALQHWTRYSRESRVFWIIIFRRISVEYVGF